MNLSYKDMYYILNEYIKIQFILYITNIDILFIYFELYVIYI